MNQIKHFDLKLSCPKLLLNDLLEFYDVITSKDQVVGRAFNRGFARIEEPRKAATCKICGKSMLFLSGNYCEDGYFEILRCHLRKHDEVLPLYLKKLEERIKNGDDSWKLKRKLKDDVDLFFNESSVMRDLNEQWCNIAEVPYMSELGKMGGYLKYRYQKKENFKMLEHLYKNFGKRLTEEERKDKELRTSSNILGDNVDGITTKLQKLFCEEVCFFDPELYESCSHNHNGDVAQFGDKEFQARFDGFEHEIEKYPEFQCDTSFDSEVLRNTSIKLDYNEEAVNELNRLLKIILSLWLVNKKNISMKLETIRKNAIVQEVFYKPLFGLLNWGPPSNNVDDVSRDKTSSSGCIDGFGQFTTFRHLQSTTCAESKTKKVVQSERAAHFENGKAFYPCEGPHTLGQTLFCSIECSCIPCQNQKDFNEENSFKCTKHAPKHDYTFKEFKDFGVVRRKLFNPDFSPIFARPDSHDSLCPPRIRFAGMKKDCDMCSRIFDDHRKNHHILHPTCQLCNHMKVVSEVSMKKVCCVCLRIFTRINDVIRHINSVHENDSEYSSDDDIDENFQVPVDFKYKQLLEKVLKTHQDLTEEEAVNGIMAVNESNKGNLFGMLLKDIFSQVHVAVKEKDNIAFNKEGEEKTQLSQKHVNIHKCDLCGNEYPFKVDLTQHIENEHTDASEYSCDVCDKKYTRNDTLLRHKRVKHNVKHKVLILAGINDKPVIFKCDVCQKTFQWKGDLEQHVKHIHEDHPDFECDQCQKTFRWKKHLERHINVHEDNPNYECGQCEKSFTRKDNLERHIQSAHVAIPNYECGQCQKTFSRKDVLERHIESAHEADLVNKCDSCGKSFGRKDKLKRHIQGVHKL